MVHLTLKENTIVPRLYPSVPFVPLFVAWDSWDQLGQNILPSQGRKNKGVEKGG